MFINDYLYILKLNLSFLNALRSGLLTFFSSLVIQESLINFAGERLRSKTDSHCESVFYFCLSASYPGVEFVFAEIASTSQPIRTSFFTMLALVWSSGRFLTAKTHILLFISSTFYSVVLFKRKAGVIDVCCFVAYIA